MEWQAVSPWLWIFQGKIQQGVIRADIVKSKEKGFTFTLQVYPHHGSLGSVFGCAGDYYATLDEAKESVKKWILSAFVNYESDLKSDIPRSP